MRTNFNEPAIFTGKAYDTEISVKFDYSDLDIDQLFGAFETIATGLGFHKDTWKGWILNRADEYNKADGELNCTYGEADNECDSPNSKWRTLLDIDVQIENLLRDRAYLLTVDK